VATFLDRHAVAEVEAAVRHQMHLEAVEGIRDTSGTLPLGHWIEEGAMYCLLDAPNQQAVCEHHVARGVRCENLHEIAGLTGGHPLTGIDKAIVLAEIARLWHPAVQR
jgi:Protein of unknown function (DUF4242)